MFNTHVEILPRRSSGLRGRCIHGGGFTGFAGISGFGP